ncbi:hypothetical protein FOMPIDRAFT_1115879 [Fomitopsis schrenkii]|uniref:BTB domain-containing protein n=1 Tax=Fomitopsis schrenkii TaxID=2126942 RepID=S8EGW8_FOMSC|nr:hypothetical protein FOMPIDRAFT_1115879 [Fomitopsis schrenkii]
MASHAHGGYLNAHQESASLDLSFSFTLDNLRSLFIPPPVDVYAEPRATGIVWPGLVAKVSRSSEGSSSRSRKARLVVNEADPNGYASVLSSPGLQITASVLSLGGQIYATRALRRERAEGGNGRAVAYAGTILAQRTFEATERMLAENAVIVRLSEESASVKPSPGARPTLELIHRVLTAQPVGRTRFILFRRRSSEGKVTCPREFYANMEELAMWYERCESLLDVDTHLEGFELPKGERLDRYNLTLENWEPDSDFDPDEEEEEEDGDLVVIGREPPESQKRSCEYPPASLAADMARASIRDEEKDIDEEGEYRMMSAHTDAPARADPMLASTMSFEMVQNKREEGYQLYGENTFDGTTIVLLGAAARTWDALLYYLYTGIIEFAPLTAQRPLPLPNPRQGAPASHSNALGNSVAIEANRPKPASSRSIYRLAHKLSLDGLRKLALHHLESQLTPGTVLTEVFSPFTAQYPEIKQLTLRSVVRYWDTLATSAAFRSKMVEVTSGRVPHAADVISEIMVRVSAARA